MAFEVKESLSGEDLNRGLAAVMRDGLATQATLTFTTGAILVAFAISLGASNSFIGIMAAVPALAQILQLPAIFLVERVKNRRTISVYSVMVSRLAWLLVAGIPLVAAGHRGQTLLLGGILLNSVFSAISLCAWNSWMRDLIPVNRLGDFYSRRMLYQSALGLALNLAVAGYLSFWNRSFPSRPLEAYSILFVLGFLIGMLDVYFISRIPEPRMSPVGAGFQSLILKPFRKPNFRNLIFFIGTWSFAVNMAAPFFTVYMLKKIGLGMSSVILFLVVSQTANMAFLRIWGRISDRTSNKTVLRISGPLFMVSILGWTFTTLPGRYDLTLPLLVLIHVLMGISTAGVTLGSGNIGLKLAPRGKATTYLAAYTLVNSMAAGIAPAVGGLFADFFEVRELSWVMHWSSPKTEVYIQTLNFQHWDFFFFIAFIIGLFSLHRLSHVKEEGEIKESVAVQHFLAEIRRNVRNFSTAGGLRQFRGFSLPFRRKAGEGRDDVPKSGPIP
ncbi:MAG: MFS transporter [bacterium]